MDSQTNKVNDALVALMRKMNVTQNEIAACIDKSQTTVSFRFKGETDWTISELGKIITLFGFDNLIDFFTFVEEYAKYMHKIDAIISRSHTPEKAA